MVVMCALVEVVISLCVGLPVARRVLAGRSSTIALAPVIGWAVFNTVALPILTITGFTRATAAIVSGAAVLGGVATELRNSQRTAVSAGWGDLFVLAVAAAALLAILPALAVWPKPGSGGVVLSEAMFDHSKAAIIDDMARLGLPPGNPFFAGSGPRLVYYYLLHFSAAIPALLLGASGWDADIALTWFTAFTSLLLMLGLAAWIAERRIAALLVVLLSLAGSLMPAIRLILPTGYRDEAFAQSPWPQSWLFQASWAPQHLASAGCVVVVVLILSRLATVGDLLTVPLLAIVGAAAFESSAWVGGVIFAASALPIGIAFLLMAEDGRARLGFALKAAAAGLLALVITFPFLRDEFFATAARGAGAPIVFRPFEVLGPAVPRTLRTIVNLPAFWIVLMVIQFPAIYFAGTWSLAGAAAARGLGSFEKRLVVGLALLAGASFVLPWLFASTIANNDLGWRGVLPGILVLTIFAAAGLARWRATAPVLAVISVVFWAAGLFGGLQIARENAAGLPAASAPVFAKAPQVWAAVRRSTAADERVANNPLFLADMVRWPVNISWALLANRRSCYAGWNLARAFVPLPEPKIDRIDALFVRIFAGKGTADDIRRLATRFDCRVVVVTPSDGAWRHDPFAGSPYFRLVDEKPESWRIYRVVNGSGDRR
jgi:hypothetical protein